LSVRKRCYRLASIIAVAGLLMAACAGCAAKPDPLCERFAQLKNAGDPQAEELLGPLPPVPADPISDDEADRLDAEFLLHAKLQILGVWPEPGPAGQGQPPRCRLALNGSYACRPLLIDGSPRPSQRVLVNPDLIVEVRDGKVCGVRVQLHRE
jgi:hypothetical protein